MPIYEFRCKECTGEFKKLVRISQIDSVVCPTCHTSKVMRLLSVTARAAGEDDFLGACSLPSSGGG